MSNGLVYYTVVWYSNLGSFIVILFLTMLLTVIINFHIYLQSLNLR